MLLRIPLWAHVKKDFQQPPPNPNLALCHAGDSHDHANKTVPVCDFDPFPKVAKATQLIAHLDTWKLRASGWNLLLLRSGLQCDHTPQLCTLSPNAI